MFRRLNLRQRAIQIIIRSLSKTNAGEKSLSISDYYTINVVESFCNNVNLDTVNTKVHVILFLIIVKKKLT